MSYAISLSVSCVSLHANDSIVKGRASAAYEKAMADLENMPDPAWHTLLRNLLVEYVTLSPTLKVLYRQPRRAKKSLSL